MSEETRDVAVGAEVLECPPPTPMLRAYVQQWLEENPEPSHEDLLSIVGFAERRGFRAACDEMERFLIRNPKY